MNVPLARISSGDTARAEIIPFVPEKSLDVEIEVGGRPGFSKEKTET